jgi:hypothetical protein
VRFEGRGKLDAAVLASAEDELGVTLPEPYRTFLLEHNGGVPEPSCFTVAHEEVEVSEFLSVSDLASTLEDAKRVGLPSSLLPIAIRRLVRESTM